MYVTPASTCEEHVRKFLLQVRIFMYLLRRKDGLHIIYYEETKWNSVVHWRVY